MTHSDQLFSNMHCAALHRLEGRDPWQIQGLSGVTFDGSAFHLDSFGQPVTIPYPAYDRPPQIDPWHFLTLLHYLSEANGAPLTHRQITFANQKDGMVRGGGFDRDAEQIIQTRLGHLSPEALKQRCLACSATLESSNADLCAKFFFAPNYPVWLKIWFADEEFPASGRLLLDASAENYLSVEDAVTVGSVLFQKLLHT